MDNRLKELHFLLTLDTDSWSDRARITLASSWEQVLEKNWKKLLVAARPVGVRGRGELRVFLFFGVGCVGMRGREFLMVLVALRKSKKRRGAADKNKERRKQRSKERRTKEVSGAAKKSREMTWVGHVYAKEKWADDLPLNFLKFTFHPPYKLIFYKAQIIK